MAKKKKKIKRCYVEITEMLDIFDKDVKSAIIKIFKCRIILKGKNVITKK